MHLSNQFDLKPPPKVALDMDLWNICIWSDWLKWIGRTFVYDNYDWLKWIGGTFVYDMIDWSELVEHLYRILIDWSELVEHLYMRPTYVYTEICTLWFVVSSANSYYTLAQVPNPFETYVSFCMHCNYLFISPVKNKQNETKKSPFETRLHAVWHLA